MGIELTNREVNKLMKSLPIAGRYSADYGTDLCPCMNLNVKPPKSCHLSCPTTQRYQAGIGTILCPALKFVLRASPPTPTQCLLTESWL